MIYHTLAPRYIFSCEWSHQPEKWAGIYFTFSSRPAPFQIELARSGLVCQTFVSRFYCPSPADAQTAYERGYEPPVNPIEYEFLNTLWYNRTPISPWGVPRSISGQGVFAFGNRGSYSVEVDFLEEGGREIWRLSSAGKMCCQYASTAIEFPKSGEFAYRGERKIRDIWELYGDMGFPQLLWRYVFSYKEHSNLVNPPSLLALLPYNEDANIYLFQYPETKIKDCPLANLLSLERVMGREEDVEYIGQHLGHVFSETILLNLFYRSLDFFGPYAFALPRGEGVWIATLSKSLRGTRRIERKTATLKPWVYEIVTIPEWDYSLRWYLGNIPVKETSVPKMSRTSFIWFAHPYLVPTGQLGLFLYELDYLPSVMGKSTALGEGIILQSGRKLVYPAGSGNLPDPSNLLFFPPRDYPTFLNYADPWYRLNYLAGHPHIKHRRFTQCYSLIPPYPSTPLGQPSPAQTYNWHYSGNFLMLGWDEKGDWKSYDYWGIPISEGAVDSSLPPPDVLRKKLGSPIKDCVFLSFLLRPEKPDLLLFWFEPEDKNFLYVFDAFLQHLLSILVNYPHSQPPLPWEFSLNPQDPTPIIWGKLHLLVWRKGKGVVANKNLGRYPIQYLFPAVERQTGFVYLPILWDMNEDGSGKFKLIKFRRNDWDGEVEDLL